MFKIFNNKELEKRVNIEAEKNIKELARIIKKPIDGEIIEIDKIIINKCFRKPNKNKLEERRKYYKEHKYFKVPVILDNKNLLVDGYTTYLLAKEFDFKLLTILRKN